jgi:hypothetical protein
MLPPIRVTSSDIKRVLWSICRLDDDLPPNDLITVLKIYVSNTFITTLVYDAVGAGGDLVDALDVLDETGVLDTRIYGTRRAGTADGVLIGGMWEERSWFGNRRDRRINDWIPHVPIIEFRVSDSRTYTTVVFRTGVQARIRRLPYHDELTTARRLMTMRFEIHPDDVERVQGRWHIGSVPLAYYHRRVEFVS